jgi:hypothetical protein
LDGAESESGFTLRLPASRATHESEIDFIFGHWGGLGRLKSEPDFTFRFGERCDIIKVNRISVSD